MTTRETRFMKLQQENPVVESEIVSIIAKLKARERDFTIPKSRMAFLNKLHKYQMMLQATRDGQPEKWREYTQATAVTHNKPALAVRHLPGSRKADT